MGCKDSDFNLNSLNLFALFFCMSCGLRERGWWRDLLHLYFYAFLPPVKTYCFYIASGRIAGGYKAGRRRFVVENKQNTASLCWMELFSF